MYHSFLIHSSADGHLGCFHVLAIINSAGFKTLFFQSREKREEGTNWEIGTDIYTLLYMKQTTKKDLLYGIGNSTLYSLITYTGKESSGLPPGVRR